MNLFTQQRLLDIKKNGYDINVSELWGNGFKIWKKVTAPILCGFLIMGVIAIPFAFLIIPFLYGMGFSELIKVAQVDPQFIQSITESFDYQLKAAIVGLISGILFAPIAPGFIKMCHDADINDKINFGSMFTYYRPKYYGKILVVTLISFLATSALGLGLLQLGLAGKISYYVWIVIFHVFMVLAIPLIIFADASPFSAIKHSFSVVSKNFFLIFVFYLLGILFTALGLVVCCIGLLFSMSYIYITNYLIYKQTIGFEEDKNEISATEGIIY
jgi:uncharacterized membrane protein